MEIDLLLYSLWVIEVSFFYDLLFKEMDFF